LESCTTLRLTAKFLATFIVIALLLLSPVVHAQDSQNPAVSSDAAQPDRPPLKIDKPKQDKKKKKKGEAKKQKGGGENGSAEKSKGKHPSLSVGDALSIEFKARVESEARTPTPAAGVHETQFDWQDRRIGIEGTAFTRITFEVSREVSEDFEASQGLSEKTAWKDAYVNVRFAKAFNVEAGRFKLPFGREELTSEPSLDFAHRSLAARVLSPGRDVGVMTHGRLFGKALAYQAGYFTRDGDNGRTSQTRGGTDAVAARLVVSPFSANKDSALAPLEIGVAAAESRMDERLGIRGRTVLGDGVFFDRVYVNGARRRVGLDWGWANGPASLSGEYIVVTDERKGMGFAGDDLPGIRADAWYAAGTWLLTGERKKGRIEPNRDLFQGGIGAIELAARVERLHFGSATYQDAPAFAKLVGNADRAATFGVNWYVNHYVKIQGDVILESIDDPERSPAPSTNGRFTSTVLLVQFRF